MKNQKRIVQIMAAVMAAIMLLSLLLSLIPVHVHAASSSEIKKQIGELKEQKEQLLEQMEEIQAQYEENEDEIADMVNQKVVIDQEIFLLHEQIDNINKQLAAYALLIADKQDELDGATGRFDELSAKNKDRIRAMEEDGGISYWSVLFKASSFSDLLDRLTMIEEIAAADQRRLDEMSKAAEVVSEAQMALEAEKDELEDVKAELDATQEVLDAKKAEAERILTELIAKGFELEELYQEIEAAEKEMLDEIARKEQEYWEAKEAEYIAYMATYTTVPPATTQPPTQATQPGGSNENTGTENGGSENGGTTEEGEKPKPTEPAKPAAATWLVPCSYRMLTSPFGERESPTAGASSNHQGVDLAGPEGTPIYASRTGVVTIAKFSKSAGYYVTINHGDGFSSIYMHMTHYVVSKGQAVSAGQVIGYMGSTGISTGSHLHFGIKYNGKYVNPANYVSLHA
jgi:murein DD-endopeptidase MepM/ murein hydrolase activator NlpD